MSANYLQEDTNIALYLYLSPEFTLVNWLLDDYS